MALVSVVMPTMGRRERALACLRRLLETTRGHALEVICPIDEDEESKRDISVLLSQYHQCHPEHLVRYKVIFTPSRQGHVRAWNKGLAHATGDYIVFAADDLWWGDGWLDEALKAMQTLPEGGGLVGFNGLDYPGDVLCTHYMLSRWFIIHHMGGVLAFPHYRYCCNDTEANERAKRVGRFIWAQNAIVRHDHPAFGRRELDDNDRRAQMLAGDDFKEFERRKGLGFPNDFPPVITN